MTSRDGIDVRPITASEFPDWNRALNTGFLMQPTSDEDIVEAASDLRGVLRPLV